MLEQGFNDVVPFYDLAESFRALHPLSNGWFAPALTARDRENTANVLAHWHDDESRAHHLQFLAWRRLREEWTFNAAPVVTGNRFFIPDVTRVLRDDEMFVDAGAHHGSVIGTFIKQTNGAFGGIAAIEPDAANRSVLDDNLDSWLPQDRPRHHATVVRWPKPKVDAAFREGLGYASQLSPLGKTRLPCARSIRSGSHPPSSSSTSKAASSRP